MKNEKLPCQYTRKANGNSALVYFSKSGQYIFYPFKCTTFKMSLIGWFHPSYCKKKNEKKMLTCS